LRPKNGSQNPHKPASAAGASRARLGPAHERKGKPILFAPFLPWIPPGLGRGAPQLGRFFSSDVIRRISPELGQARNALGNSRRRGHGWGPRASARGNRRGQGETRKRSGRPGWLRRRDKVCFFERFSSPRISPRPWPGGSPLGVLLFMRYCFRIFSTRRQTQIAHVGVREGARLLALAQTRGKTCVTAGANIPIVPVAKSPPSRGGNGAGSRKTAAACTARVPAQPEMETERFPLVSIPPFGRGFSRHGGLSIRCGFGKSAKDDFRARLPRLDEPARLSLGRVASPQNPLPFHLAKPL